MSKTAVRTGSEAVTRTRDTVSPPKNGKTSILAVIAVMHCDENRALYHLTVLLVCVLYDTAYVRGPRIEPVEHTCVLVLALTLQFQHMQFWLLHSCITIAAQAIEIHGILPLRAIIIIMMPGLN